MENQTSVIAGDLIRYPETTIKYPKIHYTELIQTKKWIASVYLNGKPYRFLADTKDETFPPARKFVIDNMPDTIHNIIRYQEEFIEMRVGHLWAKLSPEDFNICEDHRWYLHNLGYVFTSVIQDNKLVYYYLHQMIMPSRGPGISVDHINGDKLDNRRENLRYATPRLQNSNRKMFRNNTSGVTGVTYHKQNNSYVANFRMNGKTLTKSFSCKKYGETEAKRLATEYREKMFQQMISEEVETTAELLKKSCLTQNSIALNANTPEKPTEHECDSKMGDQPGKENVPIVGLGCIESSEDQDDLPNPDTSIP